MFAVAGDDVGGAMKGGDMKAAIGIPDDELPPGGVGNAIDEGEGVNGTKTEKMGNSGIYNVIYMRLISFDESV
jgi:hypothetical protein